MNILNLQQGSEEWHNVRATHFTASDAAAALGFSKYKSRKELLEEKAFGKKKDNSGSEYIFQKGHEAEEKARPLIEEMIAEDLSPVVASMQYLGLPLLASFDGITLDDKIIFEHKLWSKGLVDFIEENDDLPETHWPQVEHQLLISGADHCIFVVSDGTTENQIILEYRSDSNRLSDVISAWTLFSSDLERLKANGPEVEETKTEATTQQALPALTIELEGKVLATNMDQFKKKATLLLDNINTELTEDDHFTQAEADVKYMEEVISNIDKVKTDAMNSTASIAEVFAALDEVREGFNKKKNAIKKDIKSKKDSIKSGIKRETAQKIMKYEQELSDQISGMKLPQANVTDLLDAAVKNKRTLKSVEEACDKVFTDERLRLNDCAKVARDNLAILDELAADHSFLFSDFANYVNQESHIVKEMIENRVANHKAELDRKAQQEQEDQAQAELDAANAEEMEEIEEIAESLVVEEDHPVVDTQGLHSRPLGLETCTQATKTIHSNDFAGFSIADQFAEFNLELGSYEVTITKIGE